LSSLQLVLKFEHGYVDYTSDHCCYKPNSTFWESVLINCKHVLYSGLIRICEKLYETSEHCRYLDNNAIGGILDISQLSAHGFLQSRPNSTSGSLKILSLMNNNISNVLYGAGISVLDISTIIR